jgi:UDP-glucose 4-epimerase
VQHDRPRPGDVLRLYAETGRASSLLGFKPRVTMEEGLRQLLAWYLDKGVPPERLLENEVVHNWDMAAAAR